MKSTFSMRVAAYLVPTFPLGFLWHMVWFHNRYEALDLYRDDVLIPMGLTSMAVQAVAFAWAWPRLWPGDTRSWTSNAAYGWVSLSALAWSYTTLPVAAKYEMSSVPLFLALETSYTLVATAPVALALAWLGRADAR